MMNTTCNGGQRPWPRTSAGAPQASHGISMRRQEQAVLDRPTALDCVVASFNSSCTTTRRAHEWTSFRLLLPWKYTGTSHHQCVCEHPNLRLPPPRGRSARSQITAASLHSICFHSATSAFRQKHRMKIIFASHTHPLQLPVFLHLDALHAFMCKVNGKAIVAGKFRQPLS